MFAALLSAEKALEGPHAPRAELAAPAAAKLLEGLCGRPGGSIDAVGQHRVQGVGDMDDPRAEGDLFAGQPERVPGAVPALVMVPDRRHCVVEEAEAIDDARALIGMSLHQRPFVARERRRLEQDRIRDGELADVVEEGRLTE